MIDPFFYLLLAPPALAAVAASIVFTRVRPTDARRAVRLALIILGIGFVTPIILFVGFTVIYYAGGGH